MKKSTHTEGPLPLFGVFSLIFDRGSCRRSFPAIFGCLSRLNGILDCQRWYFSPILLASLCLCHLFWPDFSWRFSYLPFLTSLFFLGMPHGASDFARLGDFLGVPGSGKHFLFFSLYLLGMGLVLWLSLASPGISLVAFAMISIWHFGRSDLYPVATPVPALFRVLSRGLLLLSVPIAANPAPVEALANGWVTILAGEPLSEYAWDQVTSLAQIIAMISLGSALLIIALFAFRGDRASFCREAMETAVLTAMLCLLNPVFAIGAYFLFWHSLRQLSFRTGPNCISFQRLREFCGLDRRRAILFLPTVAIYLGCSVFLFETWSPDLQVALLLIFFAVVTPSHEIFHAIAGRRSRF